VAGAKVSETFREEKTKDPISKVDLFGKTLKITFERINDEGDVEEKTYKVKVVGIAEEKGSDDDYNVYMPIETVTEMIEWRYEERNYIKKNGYFLAWVKVENVDSIQMVQEEIEEMGYVTRSLKQVIDFIGDVFITLQLIFAAIGAIALIVAALGIINTMVMSIYERYREIGIMKTVGGSNTDIMKLFILEAGVIGLFGGIGGVITGFGIGKLIDLAANLYLQQGGATESQTIVVIPLWLMFGAMVFAMFIGLVAGVYPAMRAAKLSPIDALRHE
ncbi:MAG: ABC transporter permease, partial [Candidatus Methanofastidiosia archaeon]